MEHINDIQKARILSCYGVEPIDLIKGGEGSRGGRVIGHTKSGKAIYEDHNHSSHAEFSAQDHLDASDIHTDLNNTKSTLTNSKRDEASAHHFRQYEKMSKKSPHEHLKGMKKKDFHQHMRENYTLDTNEVKDVDKSKLKLIRDAGNSLNDDAVWSDGKDLYRDVHPTSNGNPGELLQKFHPKEVELDHGIKAGDKVRHEGKEHKVSEVRGNSLHFEGTNQSDWVHATKVSKK